MRVFSHFCIDQNRENIKRLILLTAWCLYSLIAFCQPACKTSTYYLRLSPAAGEKIELRGLQTLIDATIIVAGNITTTAGQQEGLLLKLDNTGATLLQKRMQLNGQPCTIYSVGALVQGDLVIAGTINNGGNQVFVARLASDLTPVWIKQYTVPTTPLQVSMQLSEDKRIALAIRITDAVICATTDLNGTTTTSSQVSVPNVVDVTGYNFSNSTVILTCNVQQAGNRFTRLVEMNVNTGVITAGAQLGNGIDETQYGAMTRFAGRTKLLGVLKRASGFSLVRNIFYQSASIETQHIYQAPANIDWNSTVGLDNTGRILGACIPQDGKLFFLRQPPDNYTELEFTKSYTVPIGAALKGVTACGDGGYLFGLNTSAGNEAILIKTDSLGTLPGCGFSVEANHSTENQVVPNTIMSFTATAQTVTLSPIGGALTDAVINAAFDCNQRYCPLVPNLDECFTSYYKKYGSHSYSDGFMKYFLLDNQYQIALSNRQDRYTGDAPVSSEGIKLFNEKGNFVKGVKVLSNGLPADLYGNKMDDQHFMLQTYDGNSGKTIYTFTLVDDNLNMLWSKTLIANGGTAGGGLVFGDMYKDQEGNYYLLQSYGGFLGTKGRVVVYKMDGSGNPVWLKGYELPIDLYGGAASMAFTSTALVIIMEGNNKGNTSIRLDKQTGNILNAWQYTASRTGSGGSLYSRLAKFDNGHIFYAGDDNNGRFLMATFDTLGRPEKIRVVNEPGSVYRAGVVKNGFLYACYYSYVGSGYSNVVMQIDTALDAVWKHEYPWDYGNPVGLDVSDNGSIYLAGNNSWGGLNGQYWDPYIIKFSALGDRGDCPHVDGALPLLDLTPVTTAITLTPYPITFQPDNKIITLAPDDDGQEVREIPCNHLDVCTTLQITGPDNICRQDVPYNFLAGKDLTCNVLPQWTFDTAYATRIRNNTSALELQFKKTGSLWVEAKVDDGCHQVTTRKQVNIQNDGASLSLGKDGNLCPGDSIILDAGAGFNSYKWQDGSTGTQFKVKQTGQYFVETGNTCGEHFYDTVNITVVTVPLLDITGDTLVCYGEQASLAATGAFKTYKWQLANGASLSNTQTASFKVLQNQQVTLQATTNDGCPAADSVQLQVKLARAIALGADTSFCSGDSVILNAGKDYANYHWNTGATTAAIIAKQAGTYIVAALDTNNCMANDTLVIKQIYSLPQVHLGADRNSCEGKPLVLDGGVQSSYKWQDGSTARYLTVTQTGKYKVSVTNSNGCESADSINILKIVPPPANFLADHDSLCTYATLDLVPAGTYSNYLWSTGSAQRSITIDKPGAYILTVADKDGCSGSDTIKIFQKDCLAGVFIPNAFTPGNDGKNDVFRAMVYGIATSFELQVYNRYGQLVFATNDPTKGWDGTVNGIKANAGTFVWQCRYHLKGDEARYKKGTVTLVR